MWSLLKVNEEACIRYAALTMIMEAVTGKSKASLNELRTMTPSQVMAMCTGYNNSWTDDGALTEASMNYGRNRAQLYLTLQRWHQTFA